MRRSNKLLNVAVHNDCSKAEFIGVIGAHDVCDEHRKTCDNFSCLLHICYEEITYWTALRIGQLFKHCGLSFYGVVY